MKLSDWPLPYVRVKCGQCDREGRMKTDHLIDRFGAELEMFEVRQKLSEPTCGVLTKDKKAVCMSILPDALLVQAITAERKEDVLDVKYVDEATKYNPKWFEKFKDAETTKD